jgi:hypothetical protein
MSIYKTENTIIVLPSDGSSDIYPENISSSFTSKLPETQVLNEHQEVCLFELIYPNSIRNIPKSTKFRLACNVNNKIIEIFQSDLDPGFYNEEKLLKKIKSHIDNWDVNKCRDTLETSLKKLFNDTNIRVNKFVKPKLTKNELINKIEMICGESSMIKNNLTTEIKLYIDFDDYLTKMLGFSENLSCDNRQAENIIDIFGQVHILYIYSDIVSPISVGGKKIPLLQMITLNNPNNVDENLGSLNRVTFENPMWVPVSQRIFDSISIDLRDDVGNLIQFESGKVVATLQFRPLSR